MEFRSLDNCDFDTVFRGFERAFADYEIHFEKEEVRAMLQRRGYNPKMSFAFFDGGGEIVAFTLNGIGAFGGIPTAYDTGTGTAKEYRGQRLAGEIFSRSIPYLKEAGIEQYLLEVLCNNDKAIAVYSKLGFETTRVFDCFRQAVGNVNFPIAQSECVIKPIDFATVASAQCFCDAKPSWQNSLDSIKRGQEGLATLGAFAKNVLAGYCVFDPKTGDLTQIAVKSEFRRKGIATRLLREAISGFSTDFIKVLNIDSTDTSLHKFLQERNIPLSSQQLEMTLNLATAASPK